MLSTNYEMYLTVSVSRMEITLEYDPSIDIDLEILENNLNYGRAAIDGAIEKISIINLDYAKELRMYFKRGEHYAMLNAIEDLKSALYDSVKSYNVFSPEIKFII